MINVTTSIDSYKVSQLGAPKSKYLTLTLLEYKYLIMAICNQNFESCKL